MKNTIKTLFCIGFFGLIACSKDDNQTAVIDTPTGFEGKPEWVKTFGGSKEDNLLSVVEAVDGGYTAFGYTHSNDGDISDKTTTDNDYWVVKFTKDGIISWSKTYGGTSDDRGEKIFRTNDGGYILAGYSRSNDGDVSVNAGLQDYWIVKINETGEVQWEKSFGFPGIDRAHSVIQTKDNGYFITGFLDVTASEGEGNDKRKKSEKHGVGEFWGIKLDSKGNKEWRRYYGGSDNDRSYDVLQTEDNGFLMIGSSESNDFDITNSKGSYDFWAVKVNSEGTLVWQKSFGGSETDVAYAIAATGNGKYVIVGDTRSNDKDITDAKGNADLWAIQIDGNGNLIWQKSFGGTEFETGRGIYKTNDGNFILTGNSRSNDRDIPQNKGQSDALSILINPNGEVLWRSIIGGSEAEFATGCLETVDHKIIIVGSSESNDFDVNDNKGSKDAIIIKYK